MNTNRTLIIVKPHAVARKLAGVFLQRFENMGLAIGAIKALHPGSIAWDKFYPSDKLWFINVGNKTLDNCRSMGIDVQNELGTEDPEKIGHLVKGWLVDHMSSDISIAVLLEGNEALFKVRSACGATLPNKAAPGTIRFDYSTDSPGLANAEKRPVYNLIHASDPDEMRGDIPASDYEISIIFPELEG